MAKMVSSTYNVTWQNVRGIAIDNSTAIAIDENGFAKVFVYQGASGTAKFIKALAAPEVLAAGYPLTWDASGRALAVYEIPGTLTGENTFNLKDWTGTGGTTSYWSVKAGVLTLAQ
jgi:cyanophycinase